MSQPNPVSKPAPAPAPAPVEAKVEGKATVTPPAVAPVPSPDAYQPGQIFRLGLDATLAPWARLGGPEGNIFGHDFSDPNQGFDHSMKRLGAVFGWKAWDPGPYFQLWLQASAAYRNYSGSKDTPGELHGFDIGAGPCLASIGLYQRKNDRVVTGPELCGAFSFLYLTGDSTAGNNFSVDKTSGPGYALSAKISPVGFNLLGGNLSPYVGLDSANIPNARGDSNAPLWAVPTFGLNFSGVIGPKPAPVEKADCSDLELRVRQGADDLETLRDKVTKAMAEFKATADALKAAGYTPEKIRDALRKGFVEIKLAQDKEKIEADIKAKTPNIKEADLKKQVDEALKAKEATYAGEAKVRYGDNFDYYNIALPPIDPALIEEARRVASDPNCSKDKNRKLIDLLDRINNERIALEKSDTQIDERTKMLHFAKGKPSEIMNKLGGLAFAQFPPVNFNGGRPDYPGKGTTDMQRLEAFLAANKGRAPIDPKDPGLQGAFKGIFAGNELLAIHRFTQQINGIEPLKGVKVKDMTEDELKQMVRTIPLVIQGHTSYTDGSPEGNMTLSVNRARAVAIAMILFGTDESRLKTEGKGITEPIVPETEDWTPSGKKVKNLNWSQEKNRRIMLLVDVEKLEQSGNAPAATKGPDASKEAPKAPALVPTGAPPKAPPPPSKGGVE